VIAQAVNFETKFEMMDVLSKQNELIEKEMLDDFVGFILTGICAPLGVMFWSMYNGDSVFKFKL